MTNYYEVRYELYDINNKSLGKFSMPISASCQMKAYNKCGEKLGRHSILYAVEISYTLFRDMQNNLPVSR